VDDAVLLKYLRVAFEYCHLHDDWVSPAHEEIDGLSAEEALWKPVGGETCIWEIVLHVANWNESIVERIETGENRPRKEGAWPPLPDLCDEVAWLGAKKRFYESIEAIDHLLETTTIEKIEQSPYGLPDLLCRFTHLGYHLGQIVKIRVAYTAR
jgi:hypothetical protein